MFLGFQVGGIYIFCGLDSDSLG